MQRARPLNPRAATPPEIVQFITSNDSDAVRALLRAGVLRADALLVRCRVCKRVTLYTFIPCVVITTCPFVDTESTKHTAQHAGARARHSRRPRGDGDSVA